ncbi:MAG: LysR family transcriptional regulator [Paracoccus sp. (in: a-proteobacteria)]|nr:LysR family transcriptional regulator [Paracoccus sp. (in: a-proteobacteria)]
MHTRHLECFLTLMRHGTMTRTAEMLGISQPAVSHTITNLEADLGFPLFVRRSGRLQPTPEARQFHDHATRAVEALERASQAAEEIRAGQRGHLSIAAYASMSISLLPRIVSLFTASRPQVRVKIISRPSETVRQLISTQQFDLAIAELPLDYPENRMEVFSYECQCMMSSDHRLAEKSVITPADLDGEPFVSLFRGDPIYQQLAVAFSKYGARWNIVAETEFFSTACELVEAGCGVGIIDPVVSTPFTANIIKRPFLPSIDYSVAILYPPFDELSDIAQDFVELLREHLKR